MSWRKGRLNSARWEAVRKQVFRRDGYRCVKCSKASRLECDHLKPLHLGGDPWALDNLQALCRGCHLAKTAGENSKGWAILRESRRSWTLFRDQLTGVQGV